MLALEKPKVLFLACPFPPYAGIAAVRTWNIARHLVIRGWDVTVVTPRPAVWREPESVAEAEERVRRAGIKRILTDHRWRCLDPEVLNCKNEGIHWAIGGACRVVARNLGIDSWSSWAKDAEKACAKVGAADVDVIFASGSPFASFSLAKRLGDRLHRPYVLDYRDPWSGNPHDQYSNHPSIVKREAALLKQSAAVTVVSPSWGADLETRFGIGGKVHVITNGYDTDELEPIQATHFDQFAVVYTGSFYPPKRVITPLFAALNQLRGTKRYSELRFHYFGDHASHVQDEAARLEVVDRVVLHGRCSRREALAAIKGSGIAVVITSAVDSTGSADMGILPGKLFETMGLGSRILVIGPPGSDIDVVLQSTGSGMRFSGIETAGIASYIERAMANDKADSPTVEPYAWARIIDRVDTVLRSAVASFGEEQVPRLLITERL